MAEKPITEKKKPEVKVAPKPELKPVQAAEVKTVQKPEAKAGQKPVDDFGDTITSPFSRWWGYIKPNIRRYYLKLLTINVVDFAVQILLLALFYMVLFAAGVLSSGGGLATSAAFIAAFLFFYVIFLLVMNWLRETIKSIAIIFTDAEFSKQEFQGLWGSFTAIAGRMFRFVVLDILLRIIITLPLIVVVALIILNIGSLSTGTGFMLILVAYLLAILYCALMFTIYSFIAQFWCYGFLLGGLGVVDALKASWSLIQRRFVESFVFDIAAGLLYIVALIPLVAIYFVLYFIMLFLLIALVPIPGGAIIAVVVWLLLLGIAVALFMTLAECVWVPTHYLFWKKISGK